MGLEKKNFLGRLMFAWICSYFKMGRGALVLGGGRVRLGGVRLFWDIGKC